MQANNSVVSVFSDTYDIKSLIKRSTCYKNPNKPSRIDLMLKNKPQIFKHSCVIKTGLPDFHRVTVTVMKAIFEVIQLRVIQLQIF